MSWAGYRGILEEAAADKRADDAAPLLLCPLCGNLLTLGTREKVCDVGHYRTAIGTTAGGF